MNFDVLIIGTDANAYYLARCYFELYNKKPTLLGHSPLPFTEYSNILNVVYNKNIWNEQEFITAIKNIKKQKNNIPLLLISSNETYAGFISKNREELLKEGFLFSYPKSEIIDSLIYKEKFYKTYQNSVLDLPKTIYYNCKTKPPLPEDLTFPVVVKPSNVILYNHLNFAGKNKIYKINSKPELEQTVETIINGGYNDCLIIQDFIPGDDSCLFDAVAYCNINGKVSFLSFAQIGLQEQTKNMVGNAAVLINGYNQYGNTEAAAEKLKQFLENIGYCGFAEFDLKYDKRDNKFKVLEINARQGRCSYYVSALGYNLVKVLADDLVYKKSEPYKLLTEKVLLSFVPKGIVKKYIKNNDFKAEALRLWNKGRVNPVDYKKDNNIKRKVYLLKRKLRYYKDYKNAYWKAD